LVVSGQNVAFLLVVVRPLTSRLRLGGRWAVTLVVIGAFAVVTRFEPSVLRASAMAALAVSAALAGRPAATGRVLALSVAGLVLIDPLLVSSVGFQLSVAASAGIALLSRRVAGRIPGPKLLAEAIGVTVAAQLGVAPVLVPRFGGLPVVSLVANVLAVPVAGLVTTWGLPAGVVAGLGGSWVASVVHLPTRLLIGWVAGVARVSASAPVGELGLGQLAAVTVALVGAVMIADHRPSRRLLSRVLAALAVAVVLAPAVALHSPPPRQALRSGGELWRSGGATVLVLSDRPRPLDLLADLRRVGTRRLDLVVAPGGLDVALAGALRHRWPLGRVLDASEAPISARAGPLRVDIGNDEAVTVTLP
jgi:ComEC/Rec2-related protein